MADEESKYFSLTEAERLRAQLEPLLIEAMESRRKMVDVDERINSLAERIQRSGGLAVAYESAAKTRLERNRLEESVQSALDQIQETGCVVKDLDVGLLDFPARIDDEEVYLCWKLGEDRIRFYHRQDEGFSGRKPIDPRDAGYNNPVQ
jgi:hypothetical protein